MIRTISQDGGSSEPIKPAKVIPWLHLEGEIVKHYPEFFFVQSSVFSGKKVITLCHKVSLKYGETVLQLEKCQVCEEKLKLRGHHEPKTVTI